MSATATTNSGDNHWKSLDASMSRLEWRTGWDSNPRYGFPYTRFPSERLQPLGHLSGGPVMAACAVFFKLKDRNQLIWRTLPVVATS